MTLDNVTVRVIAVALIAGIVALAIGRVALRIAGADAADLGALGDLVTYFSVALSAITGAHIAMKGKGE